MAVTDITINGVLMPSPTSVRPKYAKIVKNSNRTGNGNLRTNYITTKVTLEMTWEGLNQDEVAKIYSAIENDLNGNKFFFPIKYYDQKEKKIVTKTFYVSDRDGESIKFIKETEGYTGLSANFIQQ